MTVRLLPPATYARVPWKNGGGVSTTIAGERLPGVAPGDWAGVVWQFGRTAIVTPAPFSDLAGFERLQVVVAGEGLFLDTPAGAIDLSRPFTVARYDGGTPIVSRLASGPVEVVNLMARRDRARVDMRVLRAGEAAALPAGAHVLYAPAGAAALTIDGKPFDLPEDHALRIDAAASATCRAGVLIAASITPNLPS
jgi:uncharacterized protein